MGEIQKGLNHSELQGLILLVSFQLCQFLGSDVAVLLN